MKGIGPLTGYKVLDMTQFESGTVCTQTLAWLGAEVYKVERPKVGELGRYSLAFPGKDTIGFVILNMNKKSVTCNLKTPDGLRLMQEALKNVDVFIENMGPGSIDRLGLGYEDCKAINPKIIYAQIKGFGLDSPFRDAPAFAPIAQAMGGAAACTGMPGDKPCQPGINLGDSGAGYMCAVSIVAALLQRERQGVGQRIEVSMQEAVLTFGRSNWEPYYNYGKPMSRVGNGMPLEKVAPADMYPCKPFGENDYIHIYCSRHPNSNQFELLCKIIGREDMITDPRMATPASRYLVKDEIDAAIIAWLANHTKQEAMDILSKADIPAGAVLDVDDLTKDRYFVERGVMVDIEHEGRKMTLPGFAPRMSENRVAYEDSPTLGGSNQEFYGELLGVPGDELDRLKTAGVI
jgi:formyl-CoA transferase